MVEIKYLADHPELIPLLATWFFDEWGQNNTTFTIEIFENAVRQRLHRDKLPLCLVAFWDHQLVGTVALKIREMETHPHYEHWLGNVYVLPEKRNQGLGSTLVEAAITAAQRIEIKKLYLFTRDREDFYHRLGWQTIEQVLYHSRPATIMYFELEN